MMMAKHYMRNTTLAERLAVFIMAIRLLSVMPSLICTHRRESKLDKICYYITMSIKKKIEVLKETIKWFRTQIEPHDCGWMHTTIDGIKHRISDLRKQLRRK